MQRLLESQDESYRYQLIGYACSNLTREELIDLIIMQGLVGLESMYASHVLETAAASDRAILDVKEEYEEVGRYDDTTTVD